MNNNIDIIKQTASKIGFSACGITNAGISTHKPYLEQYLQKGYYGDMAYMARNAQKRIDLTLLVKNAKTVITCLLSYNTTQQQPTDVPQIAKYAYYKDYHLSMKNMLFELYNFLLKIYPQAKGRVFVDTAPVLEKYWVQQSGLGWIGKNSCLINPKLGSYTYIGLIVIDIDIDMQTDNTVEKNYCGNCTKCIDACPTGAIIKPHVIDARKCIAYQTIENKQDIPEKFKQSMNGYIFGCDICQNVCPWNNKAQKSNKKFEAMPYLNYTTEDWLNLTDAEFDNLFANTPLHRTGLKKIKNNVKFAFL